MWLALRRVTLEVPPFFGANRYYQSVKDLPTILATEAGRLAEYLQKDLLDTGSNMSAAF